MKNKLRIFNIALTSISLLVLILITVFSEKDTVCEVEKRKLANWLPFNFSSWMSGDFAKNVDEYLSDHIVGRNDFIIAFDLIKERCRFQLIRISEMSQSGRVVQVLTKSIKTKPSIRTLSDVANSSEILLDSNNELTSSQGIYIYDSCGYQFFGGTKKSASRYAKSINLLRAKLSDSIKLYSLLVPSATEFYLPKEHYVGRSNSESSNMKYLFSQLDPRIGTTNIYSRLASHNREYLYFKTDHHWTARGAYYAYLEFSLTANFQPIKLEQMKSNFMKKSFLGSLYALTRDYSLKANPDRVEYLDIPLGGAWAQYKMKSEDNWRKTQIINEKGEFGVGYGVFLGIDYPVMKIIGNTKNGRILFVLKDSYANAFIPFLVSHFETIFVGDIRYFPHSLLDFLKENQVNELLVMNHVVTANSPFSANKINKLIKGK